MKRQLLVELGLVLPRLVNGKVCVVNEENLTYETIAIGKYTYFNPSSWNPEDYAVLTTPKYRCVVMAKPSDKESYLVNKMYRNMRGHDSAYLSKDYANTQHFDEFSL